MSRKARSSIFAHARPEALAVVAAGGVAGTYARYSLGLVWHGEPGRWPVTTFAINMTGAFLLGLLLEGLAQLGPDTGWRRRARLCLGTGFLGAFTTYSSLAVEADGLIGGGHVAVGLAYLVASALLGVVAATAGVAFAAFSRRRLAGGGRA